jgi:hypothetical protein
MASTAKRKRQRTPEPPARARRHTPPRIVPVGDIESVGSGLIEPGIPDSADVEETARPTPPRVAQDIAELAAGDLDATYVRDSGEEAVGGSDPTPDQNDVDAIGTALGVTDPDEQPLATTERIEGRDRERWELDPASSEDYAERQRDEEARRRRHKS